MVKLLGRSTWLFEQPPVILSSAAVGGKMEKEGPIGKWFDYIEEDGLFGENSWEKGENKMQQLALKTALQKCGLRKSDLNPIFAGDLLNQ